MIGRAKMAASKDLGWVSDLEDSEFFLAIVTSHYVRDKRCHDHLRYAVALGKKIIVVQKEGTVVPDELFRDADIVGRFAYVNEEDIGAVATKVRELIFAVAAGQEM
jgi:hypothetical protein